MNGGRSALKRTENQFLERERDYGGHSHHSATPPPRHSSVKELMHCLRPERPRRDDSHAKDMYKTRVGGQERSCHFL